MNNSAILQMYCGERGQRDLIKPTKDYWKLHRALTGSDEAVRAKLEALPELLELYEKAVDCSDAAHLEKLGAHFVEGFKFGLRIGLETAIDGKSNNGIDMPLNQQVQQ
ncbi:MAG: hypothetical protein LBL66_09730 [Clostridiales bacterium]|jgi:hypothetical protein|nr:hypothetical protein [Clostridiales bacterium]